MACSALRDVRNLFPLTVFLPAVLLLSAAGPAARAQVGQPGPGAEARIRGKLLEITSMDFTETPLQDVVDFLKELHNIEIQLDAKALDDAGVAPDTPVNRNLKGISLGSALKLVLNDLSLTTVVTDGVLLITTPEAASNMIEVRIHDVGDLVGADGDTEKLAQALRTLLTPNLSACAIQIVPYQKLLLVRAAIPDQDELTRILPEIRDKLKAAK